MSAIEKELKDLKDNVREMLEWLNLSRLTNPEYLDATGYETCSFCKKMHPHRDEEDVTCIDCDECHQDMYEHFDELRTMVNVLIKEKE
jgi:hypothetical protein